MISELAGFTLSRTIPDNAVLGLLTGAYKAYGGVIRNNSGQIVAHLVNATTPESLLSAFSSPVNTVFSGINTYQLHRIGTDVSQLITLAKGTMALSGLTLAVSAAGFIFLCNKVVKIDKELQSIAKDVKSIKLFLELQERARLISAIRVIRDLDRIEDESTRFQMLLTSRQTLGEIHEKYKSQLEADKSVDELMPVEEYFTITAIAHAMCSAELGMFDQAAKDMAEAQITWKSAAKAFIGDHVVKKNPERFLGQRYAKHVKTEEIVNWLGFIDDTNKGLECIDNLRLHTPMVSLRGSLDNREQLAIGVTRKLVERDKVLQGYVSQYDYYASIKQRPSMVQRYFDGLPKDEQIGDCYLFVSDQIIQM